MQQLSELEIASVGGGMPICNSYISCYTAAELAYRAASATWDYFSGQAAGGVDSGTWDSIGASQMGA